MAATPLEPDQREGVARLMIESANALMDRRLATPELFALCGYLSAVQRIAAGDVRRNRPASLLHGAADNLVEHVERLAEMSAERRPERFDGDRGGEAID
jgi:hypothetical protein